MAISFAMQSLLGSPVAGVSSQKGLNQVALFSNLRNLPKRANLRVRGMAEVSLKARLYDLHFKFQLSESYKY